MNVAETKDFIKGGKGKARNVMIMFYDGGGTFIGGAGVKNKGEVADMVEILKRRQPEAETATVVYKNGKLKNITL